MTFHHRTIAWLSVIRLLSTCSFIPPTIIPSKTRSLLHLANNDHNDDYVNDTNYSNDDGHDDYDDDDDEPPTISSTPQEFLQQMREKGQWSNESPPSYGPGRGRSAPRLRQAFGKSSNDNKSLTTVYVCDNCGSEYVQWRGRCGTCQEWNSIRERRAPRKPGGVGGGGGGVRPVQQAWLDEEGPAVVRLTDVSRDGIGMARLAVPDDPEMNSVLGGGFLPGSLVLLGGDPGVGKSTLLLQMAGSIAAMAEPARGIGMGPVTNSTGPVLYVSGEETAAQIASRARRLGIDEPELLLWSETSADAIVDAVHHADALESSPLSQPPSLLIIDSIQTMHCAAAGSSSAGGVVQVRECVASFLRLAKATHVPIVLVGHVTKSGDVAGPKTVEHMVDCVLYLDGDVSASSLRLLRAVKNRFGSSAETGVYQSASQGRLLPLSDPSSFLLPADRHDAEGSAVAVLLEGKRCVTAEVQALASWSDGAATRRTVDGISTSRLLLLLAVLHKRCGISLHRRDVYVNVVGGIHLGRQSAGGSDLAVAVAIVSSLVGIPVRADTVFIGEVGLLGEIRPVHELDRRIREASRMGFSRIVTSSTKNKHDSRRQHVLDKGVRKFACDTLLDAINCGLLQQLPIVHTRTGPKWKKTKRSSKADHDMETPLDVIIDDEEDVVFE